MKLPQFTASKRLEREYAAAIGRITKRVLLPKAKEESFQEWLARLALRSQEKDVQEAADFLARRMVIAVNTANVKGWRRAAEVGQQSRRLHALLQNELLGATGSRVRALVQANAAYIKSIPLVQAQRLVSEIERAQQSGARPSTVAKMARDRWPELLRSRVDLIARTETAKASTALTQARCQDLDLQFYEWLTSEDVRVRPSHKKMNGVIVPWDDPPSPEALVGEKPSLGHYHSGACPNCRCTQRVVLTLDDIQFPARVYWGGSVHRMTKQDFKARFQFTEERAA